MISVIIADDQPLSRAGLASLLASEHDIEVVATAADGALALEAVREHRPDVACLDVRMPGRDGIEVARELCDPDGDLRTAVLMLTTFDLDEYVFGALEAGATGFMLKDAEPEAIAHAVRQVAAGHGTIDESLTRRVIGELVRRRRLQPVTVDRADELLTVREREILMLLAQGMSNDEIARELVVEVATVKSHLARMLPKLGVRSRLQAVVWAYQRRVVALPPE